MRTVKMPGSPEQGCDRLRLVDPVMRRDVGKNDIDVPSLIGSWSGTVSECGGASQVRRICELF